MAVTERRSVPRITPERRDPPVRCTYCLPAVAAVIALAGWLWVPTAARQSPAVEAGQAALGVANAERFDCWFNQKGIDKFCVHYTKERG